jgi:hypothetical protein
MEDATAWDWEAASITVIMIGKEILQLPPETVSNFLRSIERQE